MPGQNSQIFKTISTPGHCWDSTTLILTPKTALWSPKRFCLSLSNTMGWVWSKTGKTCPIWYACGPLKWKKITYFISSQRIWSIFILRQTRLTQALPWQLYIILCCCIGTYYLFDSCRKILEAFSKWEYRICFTSNLNNLRNQWHLLFSYTQFKARKSKSSEP